ERAGRPTGQRREHRSAASRGSGSADVPNEDDPGRAEARPGAGHRPRSPIVSTDHAGAAHRALARPLSPSTTYSGPADRPRRQARAGSLSGCCEAIAASRFSTIASKNCSVVIHACWGPTRSAKSLVILPDSTVSTQTRSSVSAKRTTSGVSSNLPRYLRPPVQAKIEAIGLVEVALPS